MSVFVLGLLALVAFTGSVMGSMLGEVIGEAIVRRIEGRKS